MKKRFLLLLCFLGFINSQAQRLTLRDLELLSGCASSECVMRYLQPLGYGLNADNSNIEKYEAKKGKFIVIVLRSPDENPMVGYASKETAILEELIKDAAKDGIDVPSPQSPKVFYRIDKKLYLLSVSYEGLKPYSVELMSAAIANLSQEKTSSEKSNEPNTGIASGYPFEYKAKDFSDANNDMPKGQLAYYPFDGNANDFSGNNNHGNLIKKPRFTADRNGKPNSALLLNGKDQYVFVPNSSSLNKLASVVTLSAWVRADGWYAAHYDAWGPLFCKCDQGSSYLQFCIRKSDDGYYYHTEGNPQKTVKIEPDIKLGQWFHIAIVANKNKRDFYYNGKLLQSADNYPEIQASNNPLYIGLDPHTADDYLIGALDEVVTYNRALSAAEILQLYKHTSEVSSPEIISEKPIPAKEPITTKTIKPKNEEVVPKKGVAIVLKNVLFEISTDILLPASYQSLDKLLALLQENMNMEIRLEGHTDIIGSAAENLKLSQDRVLKVKKYLVQKGINEQRITTKGYGDTKPLYRTSSEANRRVEFVITKQ